MSDETDKKISEEIVAEHNAMADTHPPIVEPVVDSSGTVIGDAVVVPPHQVGETLPVPGEGKLTEAVPATKEQIDALTEKVPASPGMGDAEGNFVKPDGRSKLLRKEPLPGQIGRGYCHFANGEAVLVEYHVLWDELRVGEEIPLQALRDHIARMKNIDADDFESGDDEGTPAG